MVSSASSAPEFSRMIEVGSIAPDGLRLEIGATTEECMALAERLGLEGIENLTAEAKLTLPTKRRIRLEVTFLADVLQLCVVTLEPLTSSLSEQFQLIFSTDAEAEWKEEVIFDATADDPPEPLLEGRIDIGEMIAQHLATLIDPYPRAPLAAREAWQVTIGAEDSVEHSPFRKLAKLKGRL